jgi:hypothetical protein
MNPIRRHCYDSVANEGIGFYAGEMMLQAGLFDDNSHTREIIYNFMRLRAVRVEVDVNPPSVNSRSSKLRNTWRKKFRWTQTQYVKKQSPFPRALAKPSLIKLADARRI